MRVQKARNSRSGSAFRAPAGQHRGGAQVLDPSGPGQLVDVGGDAVDDRPHPRQVDGDDGPVRPVGGRAQAASSPHRIAGRRCCRGRRVRRAPRSLDLRGRASPPPAAHPALRPAQPGRHRPRAGAPREGDSPAAAASLRIETPSARAETSAHTRSRSACSSRHPARETRVRTRRSRRPRLDPLADRHLAILAGAFRKLDAVAVLTARLLPALIAGRPWVGRLLEQVGELR